MGDERFEIAEQVCSSRVVEQQDRPLVIGQADNLFGHQLDIVDPGADLLGEERIGFSELEPGMISAQDIGNQPGITEIGACPAKLDEPGGQLALAVGISPQNLIVLKH